MQRLFMKNQLLFCEPHLERLSAPCNAHGVPQPCPPAPSSALLFYLLALLFR